jgi:hypothetical protein
MPMSDRGKSRRVKCPVCGTRVVADLMDEHLRLRHAGYRQRAVPIEEVASIIESISKERADSPPLILVSQRGTKVTRTARCSECGYSASTLWRYSESNRGVVYLCSSCRPIVFDRSFGEVDAIDRAWISAFETNPRKH